jgi:hypothetical protein
MACMLLRLLAACGLLLLVPATGAAAAAKTPKPSTAATFKVTARGTQVTTWSLRQPDDPNDPCDASQTGDGSQTIRFTARPQRISVIRLGRDVTFAGLLKAATTVDREGDYEVGYPSEQDCGPSGIYGDNGGLLPLKDCGRRSGAAQLDLTYGTKDDVDDLLVALIPKGALMLRGSLDPVMTYTECPWWIGGPSDGPSETDLLPSFRKVSQRALFDRRRKVIRASGDLTLPYRAPGFTGKTLITWNLRLQRVR